MGGMLWDYFAEYISILDERRRTRFDALQSQADVAELRREVREKLAAMWGPFPSEDSALNPQQVGEIDRGDYVIEKVVFESRPEFYVTANLYRPSQSSGKLPAVLVSCGHSDAGKAGDTYQLFCRLLARHGLIALIFDPIGQGERLQLWDAEKNASAVGPGTAEHRALGHQSTLVGLNLMQYRVWDARRAIDYLLTRSDVDPAKIAMAGNSGGGMTTLQYACFDDRIHAAFIGCAVASFPAKTNALLMADPEQVLYGTLRNGVDHPELLASFAPNPLIVGSALRDYVPIEAARHTFSEALRAYRLFDAAGVASLAETDEGHGLNKDLRRAGADWLSRWLSDTSRSVEETAEPPEPEELLRCTASGQVASSLGGAAVPDFNRELVARAEPPKPAPIDASRLEAHRSEIQHRVKQITHVGAFRPERGIVIPDRVYDAGQYAHGVALVVSDKGHADPWLRRNVIDPILAAQYGVVALDVRGWGESEPFSSYVDERFDWERFFAYRGLEIGKPLLGQRMKDLLSVAPRYAGRRTWSLVGVGAGALVTAHAAALDARVERLITINGLASYRALAQDPLATHPFSSYLPGVVGQYDVRDLYMATAPRPVLAINPLDSRREPLHPVKAWEEFDAVAQTYEMANAAARFEMQSRLDSPAIRDALTSWLSR